MLIEVLGENKSIVLEIINNIGRELEKHIPFTSNARIWKEELYFETPLDLSINEYKLSKHYHVESGKVYYWKPGNAFCIFYGISEPYTPVYYIGEVIGPLRVLYTINKFKEGEKIRIEIHEPSIVDKNIVKILEEEGYKTATPIIGGSRELAALKMIEDKRITFMVYVEDYGIHIEGEGLYEYKKDFLTLSNLISLKNKIKMRFSKVRLDLSEDGWVCLTGTVESLNELKELLREYEAAYLYILGELQA
mgnify:CR=1 FL=1